MKTPRIYKQGSDHEICLQEPSSGSADPVAICKEGLGPRRGCVVWHRRGTTSLLLAQRATPRCPLVFRPANKSRNHCSQQPRWKYLCVCVWCVCVLASNLAPVTQHTWAARPFLSAGASSSSQGPGRRMKREQMVWGCSEILAPRAVSSAARASWRAQHAQDQRGLSEDPEGDLRGVLMASALGWSLGRSGDLWRMMESTRTSSGTRSATTL